MALFWGVLGVLAAMPLPFGSARPWAWSLAAVLIGLLLLTYALGLLFTDARLALPIRRMRVPLILAIVPVLWAFIQILPLGRSELAHPIWLTAAEVLNRPVSGKVSVDSYATGTAVMRLFLYFGIFFLAVQLCRSSERAFLALSALTAVGAAYGLYGLIASIAMPRQLVWVPRTSFRGDLSSAFLNLSSYATFAGLCLLASIALLAKLVHRPAMAGGGRRWIFSNLARTVAAKAWAPAAAVAVLATAVMTTHSRPGLIATGLGVIVLLFCLLSATRLSRLGRAAMVALVIGGMFLTVHLTNEATGEAESTGAVATAQQRAALQELVWQGISDSPLLGHGYGAFEAAFQGYGDGTLQGYFPNAHNDYLELAFDLGLPAASLLLLAVVAVGLRSLYGVYSRRRDIVYPALGTAAMTLAGAQALIDFSLQTPAAAALLAFMLGLGYSQSWTSAEADR
jgi:O-antigen ligase